MGPCLSKEPQHSKFVCTVGGQLILQHQKKKKRTKCRAEKGGNKSGKLTATTVNKTRKVEKDLMGEPGPGSFGKEEED